MDSFKNALSGLLVLATSACVIIPIDGKVTKGEEIDAKTVIDLTEPLPNKQHVLSVLGEPEIIWPERNLFVYEWSKIEALVLVGAGYSGGVGAIESDHLLLVCFDDQDEAIAVERQTDSYFVYLGPLLEKWSQANNCPKIVL